MHQGNRDDRTGACDSQATNRPAFVEDDPFGLRPRFWSASRDTIVVSSSIAALFDAGAPRHLDVAALAVFLRTGFFVGDDTPFSAVRAVPPSACIVWRPDRADIVSDYYMPSPARALTLADAEQRFAALVDDAVRRAADAAHDPIVVTLSGGHDSSHLLFALADAGCAPDCCVTVQPYPPAAADDVEIARHLALAVGVRHRVLPQRRDRLAAEREKNALTHWCADEHAQFLPLRAHFAGARAHVFDGLGGDVLSQCQRLEPTLHRAFAEGRFKDVADHVLGDPAVVETALVHLLSADARRRFPRELATCRVVLEAVRHAGAPNPIASFFFFTRARREVALAPYAVLGCPASTSFTDRRVATFLLSLPFELVRDGRFHTTTMARRYPQFADIPYGGRRAGVDDRGAMRLAAAHLLGAVVRSQSSLVNVPGIVGRCARAIVTGASRHLWFLPRVLHLLDVEQAAAGSTTQRDSPSKSPAAA